MSTQCPECGLPLTTDGQCLWQDAPDHERAEVPCTHPWWSEEGDGHGHNSWRCTTCGHSRWIAPMTPPLDHTVYRCKCVTDDHEKPHTHVLPSDDREG